MVKSYFDRYLLAIYAVVVVPPFPSIGESVGGGVLVFSLGRGPLRFIMTVILIHYILIRNYFSVKSSCIEFIVSK